MASRELIERAARALAEAAGADSRVILFGSHARGEQRQDSDFDFLVIEPEVDDHFGESVRLARLVGELGVPADVLVASEAHVREWGGLSGTVIHDALAEGRIVGGRAAEFRYARAPDAVPDRQEMRALVERTRSWAEAQLPDFSPPR
jgi:predicted nucleotidyltransferase